MRIVRITVESSTRDTRTFELEWVNPEDGRAFLYLPGQFAELSVLGSGEAPISITSSPTQPNLQFCIKRMGVVTTAIHYMKEGDTLGVRGPYGNTFPLDLFKGKNILFIAGGIGLAPLRSVINYMLDDSHRKDYKDITILYGARTPGDLLFKYDLKAWGERPDVAYLETVDRAAAGYAGRVGFVPALLDQTAPKPKDTVAITCGPPIMIKYVLKSLTELGFPPEMIITTLEMRMKCGIGKCGRCNIGKYYVCIDGPVFSYAQLQKMPKEY
ncbi:MAG TPA: FAD/NAD(P)-binding protein [Candidatus Sumerlaeota bacterium]|nr:FAD/NAD(P)-binding protein [Candidatus Sumerlaeota bacterium]HRR31663.1 FAD/NAD(P)-binding protein [Candidatus Sumerlaeia bacterium]HON49505.1 FAD/NAD(P)-binding protein [Candidatus Sumerlaeota bacterium]HOR64654.1 FAD/NAD(P)-binding protein [Candidatus Sumerlaeota bacterium]HPL74332.1 FAD/NAD(P)-binding protein [Candidatus Sumerlaeota bacterium]